MLYTVTEDTGTVAVVVRSFTGSGILSEDVSVMLSTSDNTALGEVTDFPINTIMVDIHKHCRHNT